MSELSISEIEEKITYLTSFIEDATEKLCRAKVSNDTAAIVKYSNRESSLCTQRAFYKDKLVELTK